MYDTVSLFMGNTNLNPACLSDRQEHINTLTGEVTETGRLDNLKVTCRGSGIFIKGSLAVFSYGDNFSTLTRGATGQAIEKLADRLQCQIAEAKVWRLDLAQNFIMSRPVTAYTTRLLTAPHLKRSPMNEFQTVYFENTMRALVVYDKVAEQKAKKKEIPEPFREKNVLRYEARFYKRLGKAFQMPNVKVKDLSDEVFYVKALSKWRDNWFLITKIRKEGAFNMTNIKTFERTLLYYGLENIGGYEVAKAILDQARQAGKMPKTKFYRFKHRLQDIARHQPDQDTDTDIMTELDGKIKMAVGDYR